MVAISNKASLAQSVERKALNLVVAGSSPAGGGSFPGRSPMAQSVARQAVNLQVAGSNPAGGVFASSWESAVVQWLGYLAFTQETRVQTPAAEQFYATQTPQTAGFEPAHAEHTRLAGEPRNHLGTSADADRSPTLFH